MGSSISAKLLFIGLDNAGKTSIVTFLEEGPNDMDIKPSVAFDTKEVKYKGVQFSIYDVAGGAKVRDLWKHYYEGTDAIVFIVDSAAADRFAEAKQALENALKDPNMKKDVPILVAANKCDVDGHNDEQQITAALNLDELLKGRHMKIQATCAKKGDGIYEGFTWLALEIKAAAKAKKKHPKKAKGKGEEHPADH